MKRTVISIKAQLITFFLLSIWNCSFAQKNAAIQSESVPVPDNIKIDGNITEWGGLQAYNKNTRLWYTIANDNKNIYLVIKSTNQNNNNKILANGITLTINTADKKKEKNAFSISYPAISVAGGQNRGRGRRNFRQDDTPPDSVAVLNQQKQTLNTAKEISVLGFKEIIDTLISVYNEYSIKAAANFDSKGSFCYELSVPLNLLQISADGKTEIAYNIRVNGIQPSGPGYFGGQEKGGGRSGSNSFSGAGGGGNFGGSGGFGGGSAFGGKKTDANPDDMSVPNDFWAKYKLTNKQ